MDLKRITSIFPFSKKKPGKKGLTAIAVVEGGVALAYIDFVKSRPTLAACEFIETASPYTDIKLLRERIHSLELDGTRAVGVLDHGAYQLLLADAPDVPADEMANALRWRVKDLVGFDIDEAVIDYIELPEDAYRGRSRMVYVVVAEKARADMMGAWIEEVGLEPIAVDIPELALLNLTSGLAQEEAGLVTFHLGSPSSTVSMLAERALYFTRTLSYDAFHADHNPYQFAASAVLELQRSLDYYESQVGKPPCIQLLVLPRQQEDSPLMEELRNNLSLDVNTLDLNALLEVSDPLSDAQQEQCLLAIAAALRLNPGVIRGDAQ